MAKKVPVIIVAGAGVKGYYLMFALSCCGATTMF